MKLALDLSKAGMRVLLLEQGGPAPEKPLADPGCAFAEGERHHPHDETVRRGVGGTSAIWGGRCIPFDDADFASPGWPITAADVAPFYAGACDFLDCGPASFSAEPLPSDAGGLTSSRLERWCAEPSMQKRRGEELARSPGVETLLEATVTRIRLSPEGAVEGLSVMRDGERMDIRARAYVVACGALETTRLLLASQAQTPAAFGGANGPLGRYYMGHLSGSIASVTFQQRGVDRDFLFLRDAAKRYTRRYFQLDDATRQASGLLNMAARPELPELYDASHRSGLLSLSYMGLAMPVIGPKLLSEPLRSRKLGPAGTPVAPHVLNVLRNPVSAVANATSFIHARYVGEGRMPGLFFTNPGRTYAFFYHAEHGADPESRIRIAASSGPDALPRLHVDLRYGEADARSVVETHSAMEARLRGVASLAYHMPEEARIDAVTAQARDGAHQIGTARMSARPQDGVVDGDCRVHGAPNLFIAGSSVFRSSGQANPTLVAVALATRLAQHLKQSYAGLPV
jgi:choline dehydrogenase-like flavoprotein